MSSHSSDVNSILSALTDILNRAGHVQVGSPRPMEREDNAHTWANVVSDTNAEGLFTTRHEGVSGRVGSGEGQNIMSQSSQSQYPIGYGSTKPVFLKESDVFGVNNMTQKQLLNHTEIYMGLGNVISAENLSGIQRTGGVWRIYPDNADDRLTLLSRGIAVRGKHVTLLPENPRQPKHDPSNTTRIKVSNIPLSVEDGVIKRSLEGKGCEIIEMYREKLRINNKLTNCDTGDRVIFTKKLQNDLPKTMAMGRYYGTIWYYGQPRGQKNERQKEQTCKKCLEEGHGVAECTNEWKCLHCKEPGHKKQDCMKLVKPGDSIIEDETQEDEGMNDKQETERKDADTSTKQMENKKAAVRRNKDEKGDDQQLTQTLDRFIKPVNIGFDTPKSRDRSLSKTRTPPSPTTKENKKHKQK